MAPSGVDKGRLEVDDLIVVNESQEIVEGNGRVSAETALHLAVVRETGAGAVLHSHSIAATVLSRTHQQIGHVTLEGIHATTAGNRSRAADLDAFNFKRRETVRQTSAYRLDLREFRQWPQASSSSASEKLLVFTPPSVPSMPV